MKIHAKCIPCLLNRTLYETDLSNPRKELEVLEEACRIIGKYDLKNSCSATVATEVHKKTYEILGTKDPYRAIKKSCNQTAQALLPKAENIIKKSENRLKSAILCSIIGNVLDFGISSSPENPENLIEAFDELYSEGLGVDDTDIIETYLKKGNEILYFTDNCGEIVFDKLLCMEIKKYDVHLGIVVRGEPILTDATVDDVYEFGLDKVADMVLTTGCYAVGVDFDNLPSKVIKALDKADLIIAKGMANYETFSETKYKPIAHLLRSKCEPVAEDMEVKTDINVVKAYR
jgi:uncharacterized protein with ATP-grasp and redox domains